MDLQKQIADKFTVKRPEVIETETMKEIELEGQFLSSGR